MDKKISLCYNIPGDFMLKVLNNSRYLYEVRGGKTEPFFWLGDTAWLLLQKLSLEDAEKYFRNRSERHYNVVQAVLVHDENFKDGSADLSRPEYWDKAAAVTELAAKFGIYMAWLPVWGSMVKKGYLTTDNAKAYAEFLADRLGGYDNIVWVLGGDIRGEVGFDIWNIMGRALKSRCPDKSVTFHPFGRTISANWFKDDLLDFDMFQSGHRRYDQASLGQWDDNKESEGFFGEDNWRYVRKRLSENPDKPVLDGEPSYEGIHQGLHDFTQPMWEAKDARRYAYWSVFEGACGHTYGANSVMQFYSPGDTECSYDAREFWQEGIELPGGRQMGYLYELMNSVDFVSGKHDDSLVSNEGYEKHDRITAFSGKDFALIYNYSGRPFRINAKHFEAAEWFDPASGERAKADIDPSAEIIPPRNSVGETDMVLVIRGTF